MSRFICVLAAAAVLSGAASTASAEHHPTVQDLAWMTGSWDGPTGPDTILEENWGLPRAGTIVSLVRSTGAQGTGMVEIVHIEEAEGTLHLYLQQWNVPFAPRTENANKMTLKAMGDQSVTFESAASEGIKTLTYRRPSDDEFHVDVTMAAGQNFVIKLAPQPR